MHIEVHIFPDSFPIDAESWQSEMMELANRINNLILDGTVNAEAYAMGKTSLLALDHKPNAGYILATVDIRRS
jgi:hypothetical protein